MIELGRHIEILLLDNDCVIVPGLGGFMAHHVEAHYDEADKLFLPPLRTLGFNPQLRLNDSLLAQSYVEAYDISYPEALRRIEDEVGELRQHLDNEGEYELTDIGTLSVNDDGNLMFEPCEAGILTPELYGLGSFEMVAETSPVVATQEERSIANKESVAPANDKGEDQQVSVDDNGEAIDDDSDGVIRIKVAWIRNAVAIAAAVLAFFFITTPISNSTQNTAAIGGVSSNVLMRLSPDEMTRGEVKTSPTQLQKNNEAVDTTALAIKNDTVTTKNVAVTSRNDAVTSRNDAVTNDNDALAKPSKDYCIVLASHVSRKGAGDYVRQLRSDGYSDASIYERNGVVRVVYGNYETENKALHELRKLRDDDRFEQSWIYKKR